MIKDIRITMDDGTVWEIPASLVAARRAEYFAEADEARDGTPYTETFHAEYEYGIETEEELADWLWNNTDWADIKEDARLIHVPGISEDYLLVNASLSFD